LPARGIKRRLSEGRFDAVWVHGWSHIGLLQAMRAAQTLKLPVLMRGETLPDAEPRRDLRRRLRNLFCRNLFQRIACFLCVGERNAEFYRQFGVPEERLVIMPYAVDNDFFRTRSQEASARREVFRRELELEPGRAVVLFVARLGDVKAPDNLLAAYQRAWGAEQRARPYLLFVGDGPLRSELEAQAGATNGNDIRFLGFKNQSELPALYDLCDVFVLPSSFEPWGLVVNEVMNAAKPVIVSDRVGAAPDLVSEGVNGCVYPHGDVSALAFKLKTILELPQAERECMGRKSLERIGEFSFEANHNALLEALRLVCKRGEAIDDILK
jgi:glycosyltransferase involved in cell wall biosynthesis